MNNIACELPSANELTSNDRSVYAVSAAAGSVNAAIVDPSIVTVRVSVNGRVTLPIRSWNATVAGAPVHICVLDHPCIGI